MMRLGLYVCGRTEQKTKKKKTEKYRTGKYRQQCLVYRNKKFKVHKSFMDFFFLFSHPTNSLLALFRNFLLSHILTFTFHPFFPSFVPFSFLFTEIRLAISCMVAMTKPTQEKPLSASISIFRSMVNRPTKLTAKR